MTVQEIYGLAEGGFTTFVAIMAVMSVFAIFKIITKYLPDVGVAFKGGLKAFQEFVNAINKNTESTVNSAKSIDKNTVVTNKGFEQSVQVLEELRAVNLKFNKHDANALEVYKVIDDLIKVLEKDNNSKELLTLLKQVLARLDEFEEWNGLERRLKK